MSARRPLPLGYVGALVPSFTELEIAAAVSGAFLVHVLFLVAMVAVALRAPVPEPEAATPREEPIAVKPVLDEPLPLLKLGGPKKPRYKLPDMWQKSPPIRRHEARSAPSPDAKDDPRAIPSSRLVEGDAEAPPPDAELAAEVDELQPDASETDAEATAEGEGSPDGVKEGTEADPLKARAVSQYTMKILAWFNARFTPPGDGAPCAELKALSAGVAAQVGGDRSVVGYSVTRPSGNATFDAKVRATMDAIVGQQLPPPPPLYPDILGTTVPVTFSGRKAPCE